MPKSLMYYQKINAYVVKEGHKGTSLMHALFNKHQQMRNLIYGIQTSGEEVIV